MSSDSVSAQAQQLVAAREHARAARDFSRADGIRDQLRLLGFDVVDTADGPLLRPASPFVVYQSAAGDGKKIGVRARAVVTVIVDGWVDDAATCVSALLTHEAADIHVVIVEIGNRDAAGMWAQTVAREHPERVTAVHLCESADHWARIHLELIRRCESPVYAVMDASTVITGPAISTMCDVLNSRADVVAVGWRGADVDIADEWRSVIAADGEVDVLLSYLMVVRTTAAMAAGPNVKAKFYRNADIEWCLALRDWHLQACAQPAQMLAIGDAVPATQGRHHGYHDSDPDLRDRESRKTYDRILQRYRGRVDMLKAR